MSARPLHLHHLKPPQAFNSPALSKYCLRRGKLGARLNPLR
jgi:hypothetical protein